MNLLKYNINSGSNKFSIGSGILPVALLNNKLYFLFGKETFTEKSTPWSDFGGIKEDNEDIITGAIREGYEETSGFLGDLKSLTKIVKNNQIAIINSINYTTFLYFTDYCEKIPIYYNNNFKFIKNHFNNLVNKNGFHEKSQIKWFSIDELTKKINNFRIFYQPFIETIIENHNEIKNKIINYSHEYTHL